MAVRRTQNAQRLFPLPAGEGQGEGERNLQPKLRLRHFGNDLATPRQPREQSARCKTDQKRGHTSNDRPGDERDEQEPLMLARSGYRLRMDDCPNRQPERTERGTQADVQRR